MRIVRLAPPTLALLAIAGPAFADSTVSWATLDPGNDWAAMVLRSVFPIPGATAGTPTGNEASVIQLIIGQFTGFISAIACAWVCYTVIVNIHRAAESSQVFGSGQSTMSIVRIAFAAIMMFPVSGGFSVGQQFVMQGAMWGIGMARAVYTNAIQAVGPDAIVIAQPMIPGTQKIVAGLIDSELCMDLVNLASGTTAGTPLVPIPQPVTSNDISNGPWGGGYITYRYSLSIGNESGNPVCGTVTVREPLTNESTVAGVNVDMAGVQQAVLGNVLAGSIRNPVAGVALNLWQTRQASALVPLQGILTNAVSAYQQGLTAAATGVASALNTAIKAEAQQARNGNSDLLTSEVAQSTLGWTAAGAYYLEIAKLNAATLSLLNATPITSSPTYEGLGPAMSYDLAPLETAQATFMTTLNTIVQTQDGTSAPNGVPNTLANAKENATGMTVLDRVFSQLNLSNGILSTITTYILPTTQVWTDPFGGLMQLGQLLINVSLAALGAATVLSSATASTGAAIWTALTFNWGATAATLVGHQVMGFLGIPIFLGLLSLLIPGLIIAYVLPMVPYVMWMAGVLGWIILVCEAMIAVPLWMLAHMTMGGEGLHGRAIEGWGLLFSIVFRPVLMVIGLFLGYFVFDCMSWLIRQSFGIAAGAVLSNGWIVANFLGIGVLLTIFVMLHVAAAIMSFRLVALLPHHLPRLIGFSPANRVDTDGFQNQAAWAIGGMAAGRTSKAIATGANDLAESRKALSGGAAGYISGPKGIAENADSGTGGMDSTLRAVSSSSSGYEDKEDV